MCISFSKYYPCVWVNIVYFNPCFFVCLLALKPMASLQSSFTGKFKVSFSMLLKLTYKLNLLLISLDSFCSITWTYLLHFIREPIYGNVTQPNCHFIDELYVESIVSMARIHVFSFFENMLEILKFLFRIWGSRSG